MEADPPSPENSDHGAGNTSRVRSYGCTFCKRGFSNAQALGGHMNIHLKEKAKLKEPSTITKKNLSSSSLGLEPNENKGCTLRQPKGIVSGELQQLQLFVDRPSSNKHHKSGSNKRENHMTDEDSLADKELDLELRLGHESC